MQTTRIAQSTLVLVKRNGLHIGTMEYRDAATLVAVSATPSVFTIALAYPRV